MRNNIMEHKIFIQKGTTEFIALEHSRRLRNVGSALNSLNQCPQRDVTYVNFENTEINPMPLLWKTEVCNFSQ